MALHTMALVWIYYLYDHGAESLIDPNYSFEDVRSIGGNVVRENRDRFTP